MTTVSQDVWIATRPPTTEEAREHYWLSLYPLIVGPRDPSQLGKYLDDWELSILAVLLFWVGPKAVPGQAVRKSMTQICGKIGSIRNQGRVPAKRPLITKAAKRLISAGLLQREEDECLWTLRPRPQLRTQAQSQAEPQWEGTYRYNARLWRRDQVPGGAQVRAAASRLSFFLNSEGNWQGELDELMPLLQVKSRQTAEKRLIELERLDQAITISRGWDENEGETISITYKAPEPLTSGEQLRQQALALREELWYPELVDAAIRKAAAKLKTKKVTPQRAISGFYRPVLEMQEKFTNPPLIKYALEQTLVGPVFRGEKTTGWHRYCLRVAENNRWRFNQASDAPEQVEQGSAVDMRGRELAARELLTEAAQLNGTGRNTEARKLLDQLLDQAEELTPLFAKDKSHCEQALRLAFKQGSTDFVGVRVDEYAMDYLPEWRPGE